MTVKGFVRSDHARHGASRKLSVRIEGCCLYSRALKCWALSLVMAVAGLMSGCAERSSPEVVDTRPNVLFIVLDDLNDWLGCYGDEQALTPNIDRLAERGVLFERAYCAAPVCNASRVSVLTGKYPFNTGIYNDQPMFYSHPGLVSLPAYFRKNGYEVFGGGKVFHQTAGHLDVAAFDSYFQWRDGAPERAWGMDYTANYAELLGVDRSELGYSMTARTGNNAHFDFHALENELEPYMADSMVTGWATGVLLREHKSPFFLAVGLYSPHKPNYVPRRYFSRYDKEGIVLPATPDNDLEDLPRRPRNLQVNRSRGLDAIVSKQGERVDFVHGYLASIAYADEQVGRLLNALDKSMYRDNTIIVLWSDNGYHNGEKMHWGKQTLWERATHVPLIIAGGGDTRAALSCSRQSSRSLSNSG